MVKLVKRGDNFKLQKLNHSLKRASVSPTQRKDISDVVNKYVKKTKNPSTLGVRKVVEAYLKEHNLASYKKYKDFRKK